MSDELKVLILNTQEEHLRLTSISFGDVGYYFDIPILLSAGQKLICQHNGNGQIEVLLSVESKHPAAAAKPNKVRDW